jgi:hypothetical protein
MPGGGLNLTNVSLRTMITMAYDARFPGIGRAGLGRHRPFRHHYEGRSRGRRRPGRVRQDDRRPAEDDPRADQ